MTKEELEEEAKQSYLDNTDEMQWDEEDDFNYTRGYLNGAEPREKRIEELEMTVGTLRTFSNEQATSIEELEKRNAELKTELTKKADTNHSLVEQMADLESKNAELKENYYLNRCLHSGCPYLHIDNRNCTKFGGFFTSVSNKDCPMMKNLNANIKLTKAKEIIRQFLNDYPVITKEMLDKLEQFIKDVEK